MDAYTRGCLVSPYRKIVISYSDKMRTVMIFSKWPSLYIVGGKSLFGNSREWGGFDERRRLESKYFISCQCGREKRVWLRLVAAFAFSTSGLQT